MMFVFFEGPELYQRAALAPTQHIVPIPTKPPVTADPAVAANQTQSVVAMLASRLADAEAQLGAAQEPSSIKPKPIPTVLELKFDVDQGSESATEVAENSANIYDWTYIAPNEAMVTDCPNATPSFLNNNNNSSSIFGAPASAPACYSSNSSWAFVLIFKRPVHYKAISFDSYGLTLPKADITLMDPFYTVIWFHGDMPIGPLDIKMVN